MSKKILIIAGLDPSGNAGLLRDLEIAASFNIKSACVVTALTAQNKNKFIKTQVVSPSVFTNQVKAILPLSQYDAIKIGMLGDEKIIKSLLTFLKKEKRRPPIILDPIIQSSTGGTLLSSKGRTALFDQLIPLVDLWTPNLDEASFFSNLKIRKSEQMKLAAQILFKKTGTPVFLKGGHLKKELEDFFTDGVEEIRLRNPRLAIKGLRGTGCALSTMIACFLSHGYPLSEAVKEGRRVMQEWLNRLL